MANVTTWSNVAVAIESAAAGGITINSISKASPGVVGYTGTDRNDETRIRRYENQCEKYPIPLYIARLAWLIDGVMASAREEPPELWPEMLTDDGTGIDWPQWPGYDYSHEPR